MSPLFRPIALFLLAAVAFFPAIAGEPLPAYSRGYSATRDPFVDARAAIALARQTERRILIEVGGEWCSWCHVLERVIRSNPELEQTLHRNYVLLRVNVSADNDNAAFVEGLPRVPGYPKLFVSRPNGSIIHSQDPTAFLRDGTYDPRLVMGFLKRWIKPEP